MNPSPASSPDPDLGVPNPDQIVIPFPASPPRVVYVLLGLTLLIYLLQIGSEFLLGVDLPLWIGAKSSELIRLGQVWRLITPILLHGSLAHIAFNMYALLSLGPGLEQRFGPWRFLTLYLLSGFAGNVFSFLFTQGLSVGASTSIFGLLAAEGVFLYQNRRFFGEGARPFLGQAVFIVVINLLLGLTSGGRIDNWGHLGGLLGGAIFTWFGGPRWDMAGLPMWMYIVDRRTWRGTLLAAGFTLALFGALAWLGWNWWIP